MSFDPPSPGPAARALSSRLSAGVPPPGVLSPRVVKSNPSDDEPKANSLQPFDKVEVYSQLDLEFERLLSGLNIADWQTTVSGIINPVTTSDGERGKDHYQQHRGVAPFMASFVCWLMTGGAWAAKNNHYLRDFDHSMNNTNPHTFNYLQVPTTMNTIADVVRSLFTYAEVQQIANSQAGPASAYAHVYVKFMAIVDRTANVTFLIKLQWDRTAISDAITVTVRQYNRAPVMDRIDFDGLQAQFAALGF